MTNQDIVPSFSRSRNKETILLKEIIKRLSSDYKIMKILTRMIKKIFIIYTGLCTCRVLGN